MIINSTVSHMSLGKLHVMHLNCKYVLHWLDYSFIKDYGETKTVLV